MDKPTNVLQKRTLKTTDRKGAADGSSSSGAEERSRRTAVYGICILKEEVWIWGKEGGGEFIEPKYC